jgi:hypothetical protein
MEQHVFLNDTDGAAEKVYKFYTHLHNIHLD